MFNQGTNREGRESVSDGGWHPIRGLVAATIGCLIFVVVATPGARVIALHDTQDILLYGALLAMLASAVYWLFARPRK
jgi:hypothetical protein